MKNKLVKGILLTGVISTVLLGCQSKDTVSKNQLETIREAGVIVFATEGTYSPFSYHDENDQLVGYDVEIAEAVADRLGVKAQFIETKWDGIIAGLDAQKYDVIANQVGITSERKEKYLFSTPYTYSYGVVITKSDNKDISSFEDLSGKKLAQTTTSNWARVVESYNGEIVATEGFNQSIELVLQGRVDATVNDYVTYLDYKNIQKTAEVKISASSNEVSESAFLIRKSDGNELQTAINEALFELHNEGTLKEISNKYFGTDISSNQ